MIEVYIYMLTPQDLPFFYFIDGFIARSTICYLLSAKKINTNTQKNNNSNNALESLLPSPHPKVCHPKRFFLFFGGCFSYFCWVCSRLIQAKSDSFGLDSKASCVYQMHPSQTIVKKVLYAKHAQVFLGGVQFSF